MGFEEGNLLNEGDEFGCDGGGGGGGGGGGDRKAAAAEEICCSICLDAVTDDGKRSWAKLQCSHQFHLDCIGSAFNAKRAMQCPNCRNIEKGKWLYAKGSQSRCDNNINGNTIPILHDPFNSVFDEQYTNNGLAQFPSPYDEAEFLPTYYGATATTVVHSSGDTVYDATYPPLSFSRETIPASYSIVDEVVVIMDLSEQHHSIPRSSLHVRRGGGDEQHTTVSSVSWIGQRIPTTTTTYDAPLQQGSVMQHPLVVDHRSGSSVTTSTTRVQPYRDSIARSRDRVQALEAYHHQSSNPAFTQVSGISGFSGRSNGQNNIRIPVLPPIPSPSNHAANRLPSHQPPSGSGVFNAPGVRFQNAHRRYGVEGRHSQNRL